MVSTLLASRAAVRALTRKPENANLPEAVEVVAGDLADPSTLGPNVFQDVDRAFVFPARGVEVFMDAAVAAGVRRFTVLSSLATARDFPLDHPRADHEDAARLLERHPHHPRPCSPGHQRHRQARPHPGRVGHRPSRRLHGVRSPRRRPGHQPGRLPLGTQRGGSAICPAVSRCWAVSSGSGQPRRLVAAISPRPSALHSGG
ncbi:NAD(P)H-binding protein [Nocardia sp. ET3-3]|uniref:NAD(P)H-binding protein n=1 Tax=Nocardia terrae TaxID=2675851 RepID=A0A7K1UWJ5_9NOCA|nr:NAD(P)H-binding protein [Nocardia terrae]